MKILSVLIIGLTGFAANAGTYITPAAYSKQVCAAIMRDGAIFSGPDIRGAIVGKIKNALEANHLNGIHDFDIAGIVFGQDILATWRDRETISFQKAPFHRINTFFSAAQISGALTLEEDNALEATLMGEIGALVYDQTAEDLFKIYRAYTTANKIEWPKEVNLSEWLQNRTVNTKYYDMAGVRLIEFTRTPSQMAADRASPTAASLSIFGRRPIRSWLNF